MTLTHLDLFSGIGGFALAAGWAGFQTIGFVEIDKYCQKVLNKHWPDVPVVEDIRDVETIKLITEIYGEGNPITLITGGFPCQPFSVAGVRRGKSDNRYLWPEMFRVIREVRPRWVLGENVAGIVRVALDDCIVDLEGEGYTVQSFIIPACGVNAPHRRDRIWIVAHSIRGRKEFWSAGRPFDKSGEAIMGDSLGNGHTRGYSFTRRAKREGEQGGLCQPERASIMAIPEGRESRQQTESEGGQGPGRGSQEVAVADTPSNRGTTGIPKQESGKERISEKSNNSGSGEIVADTSECNISGSTLSGWGKPRTAKTEGVGWRRDGQSYGVWAVEPELGGRSYGFPLWLYRHCGRGLSYEESNRRAEVLRKLWNKDVAKALWFATRGYDRMEQAEILFAFVCEYETDPDKAWLFMESAEALVGFVFGLWEQGKTASSPPRPEDGEQLAREHSDSLQAVSRLLAYTGQPHWQISSWEDAMPRVAKGIKNRVDRLKCLGNAIVPQVAYQILKGIAELETDRLLTNP